MNASRERSFGCISPVKQNPRRPSASPASHSAPPLASCTPKGRPAAIRNERLAPLAEQPRAIWTMLRRESNVDLGAIRLAGSGQTGVDVQLGEDREPVRL